MVKEKEYFSKKERVFTFLEILESWKNTPYRRNIGIKGRGVDCSLFLACSYFEIGIIKKIVVPEYLERDWHTNGNEEIFMKNFENHKKFLQDGLTIKSIREPFQFGDWLVFSVSRRHLNNHSAIYIDQDRIIHSIEKLGVVEDSFKRWKKYLTDSFRLYEVLE